MFYLKLLLLGKWRKLCSGNAVCPQPTDHKLTDSFLRLNNTEHITSEHNNLKHNYSVAAQVIIRYKEQLIFEQRQMKQSDWELNHQERRSKDYETKMDEVIVETEYLRYRFPMIGETRFNSPAHYKDNLLYCVYLCYSLLISLETVEGCRRCPAGWILMNSMCYYFPIAESTGYRTFTQARVFCQTAGGDLATLDSKDKQVDTHYPYYDH